MKRGESKETTYIRGENKVLSPAPRMDWYSYYEEVPERSKVFQIFRGNEEFYIVCKDKYIFWNYISLCWNSSMYPSWKEKLDCYVVSKSSWLELLIVTGQTKDQAMDAWRKFSKG